MLLYYLFWMLMGFILHFYIVFGTNLLTGGPAQNWCFLPISEFRRKRISNGVQTEWNLRERDFWNKRDPKDLEWTSRNGWEVHEARGAPSPLVAQANYFFLLYILIYPENIEEHHKTLFPPPQPSVAMRSHLGAFSGAPLEGALITEGFYINTIASPMMCE